MSRVVRLFSLAAFGLAGGISSAPVSFAGEEFNLGNRPWDFSNRNHAGIAALIEQKANGTIGGGGGNGSGGGGRGCGGSAGNSTAIGNYTCIIIDNGSKGMIEIGQDTVGNQDANTQTTTNGDNALSSTLETLFQ